MLKREHNARTPGFTIVELLIVVVVIAILAAITVVAYNGIRQRAVISSLQSDLTSTAKKLETDKQLNDNSQYTNDVSTTGIQVRESVEREYFKKGDSFCLSLTQGTISQYITNGTSPKAGLCSDNGFGSTQTIFTYNTNLPNCVTTVQLPVTRPTNAPGTTIDWGDGTTNTLTAALQSHTYASEGMYTVKYNGPIDEINTVSVGGANQGCLSSVDEWKTNIAPTKVSFSYSTGLTNVSEPPTTVTDMTYMFASIPNFNHPIGDWDMSNVRFMEGMFNAALSFNQPLGNWNTSKVESMDNMFSNARAFNQPIANWNTGQVIGMSSMFFNARAFNQPIGNWNISKVTSMNAMFSDAYVFNQPIGSWNTNNVTNMTSMFFNAYAFNQAIGGWDTSNVTGMTSMFFNASRFNQDLSSWNVASVTSKPPYNFSIYAGDWTLPKPNW
jgi:prepilin-type N-terminal cleavage/methylation domain-containing protein